MSKTIKLTPEAFGTFITDYNQQHVKHLKKYFGPFTVSIPTEGTNSWAGYAGRYFEHYSTKSSPAAFDGNDLSALACLSVDVDFRLAGAIAALQPRFDSIFGLITNFDRETKIWDVNESDLMKGSPLHDMWDLLVSVKGIGPTIASKMMASKFPHLITVIDKEVRNLVEATDGYWLGWHRVMKSDVRTQLENLRSEAGLPDSVSLLRTADVCLWKWAKRRSRS